MSVMVSPAILAIRHNIIPKAVIVSGNISIATFTPADIDLTASGYLDYVVNRGATWSNTNDHKSGANLLTGRTYFNATDNNTQIGFVHISFTDGTPDTTLDTTVGRSFQITSTASPGGLRFVAPAGTASKKVRAWVCGIQANSGNDCGIRATLSDGSFAEQTLRIANGGANKFSGVEITYNAATVGQSLTVQVETTQATNAQAAVIAYAYF